MTKKNDDLDRDYERFKRALKNREVWTLMCLLSEQNNRWRREWPVSPLRPMIEGIFIALVLHLLNIIIRGPVFIDLFGVIAFCGGMARSCYMLLPNRWERWQRALMATGTIGGGLVAGLAILWFFLV